MTVLIHDASLPNWTIIVNRIRTIDNQVADVHLTTATKPVTFLDPMTIETRYQGGFDAWYKD